MKKIFTLMLVAVMAFSYAKAQEYIEFTEGDFSYYALSVPEEGYYSATVTATSLPEGSDVIIPESVMHDGVTYPVRILQGLGWRHYRSLYVPASVETISDSFGYTNYILENFEVDPESQFFATYAGCLYNRQFTALWAVPKNSESVEVYYTTKIIKDGACSGSQLQSVSLPEGLEEIESYAFGYSFSLSQINFPSTLKVIGIGAFAHCLISTCYIGPELMMYGWGNHPFTGCPITAFEVSPENPYYSEFDGSIYSKDYSVLIAFAPGKTTVEFHPSLSEINMCAFSSSSLEEVVIPSHVSKIGEYAFNGCDNLTKVVFEAPIETIEVEMFGTCWKLKEVVLPNTLKEIKSGAFYYCDSLGTVIIPSSVEELSITAFTGFDDSEYNARIVILNRYTTITDENRHGRDVDPTYYARFEASQQLREYVDPAKVVELRTEILNHTDPIFIGPDSSYTWVSVSNLEFASSFQLDFVMPQGLTLESVTVDENAVNADNLEVAFSKLSNGDYRILGYTKDASIIGEMSLVFGFSSDSFLDRGVIECKNTIQSIQGLQLDCGYEGMLVTGYDVTIDIPETMEEGDTYYINNPVGSNPYEVSCLWSSDNNAIVTIEGNNMLVAKRAGKTTVNLEVSDPDYPEYTFTRPVTVTAANWGDVDQNGEWNVADLVAIINYILERNPENFNAKLADVDRNGTVNVVDVTALIRIILEQEASGKMSANAFRQAGADSELAFGTLLSLGDGLYSIPVELTPTADYTAMQADFTLPEGVALETVTLGSSLSRHTHDFAPVGDNSVRVIVYSTSLATFGMEEGINLVNLVVNGKPAADARVSASRILTCDTEGRAHSHEDVEAAVGTTAGAAEIGADAAGMDIYRTDGVCVKRGAGRADIEALSPGVYVIGGKKVVVK